MADGGAAAHPSRSGYGERPPDSYHSTSIRWYADGMKVDKMSISLDAALGDQVRDAARKAGQGLSAWIAEAATARIRSEALAEFLDAWEAEYGAITAEELERAEAELGLTAPMPAS